MKSFLFLLGMLWVIVFRSALSAQCCTAGNPVSTNCALTDNGKNILTINYSYMYSFSDAYYKGTERLNTKYIESHYDYSSLAFSYGISSKLRFTADIGYFFDKAQQFVNNDYTRFAQGISDGTLGINYSTYTSEDNLFEIMQSAKVTIPVGAFNQEYEGVVLPIDFQPSSGNYRYNLGLILSKRFSKSALSLMSFNSIEFSQAIETRNTYHKYGNLYNISLMGIYRVAPYLQGLLQLRWEMRDRALNGTLYNLTQSKNNQYSYINATGGVIAYVSPQVSVNILRDWTLSLQYNYPFYKNVYGVEQLTNRHSISANISRVINFGGMEPEANVSVPDTTLLTYELAVRGNCDMCKSRIEAAAASIKNVSSADWNEDTKILSVHYKDVKPDSDEIEKALAAVGHDTDKYKALDEVYNKLPTCCLYRK